MPIFIGHKTLTAAFATLSGGNLPLTAAEFLPHASDGS
jgi:hypothetical protein